MNYSLMEILLIFATYAILGWVTEVVFFTLKTGKFVNRGFLNGPLCPLYGFGVLGVLLIMSPIHNVILLFAGSMLFCTLIELITGTVLEKLFHDTWWDYSDEPFNFKGYICLKFSVMWGIACVMVIRILHPGIMHGISALPFGLAAAIAAVFYVYLAFDLFVTVRGINNVNRALGKMAERMRDVSDYAGVAISDIAKKVDEAGDYAREEAEEIVEERKAKINTRRDAYAAFLSDPSLRKHRRLLRAFPAMRANFRERFIGSAGEQFRAEIEELFERKFRDIE